MFNELETQQAAAMGWQLCRVYDPHKRVLILAVLPLSFDKCSAPAAYAAVVEMAKSRNPLAIRALTLIAQFNAPRPKKGKK